MKRLLFFMSFLFMASVASATVSTKVYLADGNTPLELIDPNVDYVYRDIMVGTKLTIVVWSDVNEYWVGDLFIAGENRDYGILTAASCLPAAGEGAFLYPWEDDFFQGFCFQTGNSPEVGDWFITDYNATNIGDCNVGLYEWFSSDPNYELSFSHVRTRDFNGDGIVNFTDFAVLAFYWQENSCNDLYECDGADLNTDGNIDFRDLMLFADYWLEKTE